MAGRGHFWVSSGFFAVFLSLWDPPAVHRHLLVVPTALKVQSNEKLGFVYNSTQPGGDYISANCRAPLN